MYSHCLFCKQDLGVNEAIERFPVYRNDMEHMQLPGAEGGDPYRFLLKHSYGRQELSGEVARRALGAPSRAWRGRRGSAPGISSNAGACGSVIRWESRVPAPGGTGSSGGRSR